MYNNKSTWPLLWPATGCSLGPANPLAITHRNSIVHCTITISWNLAVKEPISGTFHIMHLLLRLTQCYTLPLPGIFLSAIYNPPCRVVRLTTVRTGLIYLWQWWKVFEDVKDLVCLFACWGSKQGVVGQNWEVQQQLVEKTDWLHHINLPPALFLFHFC